MMTRSVHGRVISGCGVDGLAAMNLDQPGIPLISEKPLEQWFGSTFFL